MKKGYGSQKGAAFERRIAKELSLWLSGGKDDGYLWRTHASGSLGTRSNKPTEFGDIMSIRDEGRSLTSEYNIECRHGKCIKIRDLVYLPAKSSMVQFIEEGELNAKLSNRKPLWIFREQGAPIMVMMHVLDLLRSTLQVKISIMLPEQMLAVVKFDEWKRCFKVGEGVK